MPRATSRVQSEIKQKRPFRSREQEAAIALLRTADVVRRRIAEVILPHGVTLQQYNVLRILAGAGGSGMPTLEIATRMIERAPGITRLLDRLEAKGLIQRERCATDRREVTCRIAEKGTQLLKRMEITVNRADHKAVNHLAASDLERLIVLLDGVRREVGGE
jgi:DNA-binding MarR family transcriptional regulator